VERAGPRGEAEAPLRREVALDLEVTPIERRRWLPPLNALAVLAVFFVHGLYDGEIRPALGAGLGPALLVLLLTLGIPRIAPPYRAQVSAHGLHRDGQLVIARKDLVAGQVLTARAAGAYVQLVGRPGQPSPLLRVKNRATADELLRVLALDEDHVLIRRVVPWTPVLHLPAIALVGLSCLAAMVLLVFTPNGFLLVPAVALVAVLADGLSTSTWLSRSLKIGRDGLLLSTLGRPRFHPFAALEAIRPWRSRKGVDLVFAGGEVVPIYTRTFLVVPGVPGDVREQIEAAWRRYQEARQAPGTMNVRLARGGRDLTAWAHDLARLGRDLTGYREEPLEPEDLAALVESPAAAPEERAAAAFALTAANVDPEVRHRLRVAAHVTAAPDLRDALCDLAQLEDEEARVAALRRLSSG
jgi:hypothetical protein